MILYSPSGASAFEKSWAKMGFARFERRAAGGDRCGDIPAGGPLWGPAVVLCLAGGSLFESRLRSSAGEAGKMAGDEQRRASRVMFLNMQLRARGKIRSQPGQRDSQRVRESESCSVPYCTSNL